MLAEQSGSDRLRRQAGIKPQHEIGPGVGAFQFEAVEHGDTVTQSHPFNAAIAGLLESLLDLAARAPFGHEAFVGVDRQRLLGLGQGSENDGSDNRAENLEHNTSNQFRMEAGNEGDSRFRSQSLRRHNPDQVQRVGAEGSSQPQACRRAKDAAPR